MALRKREVQKGTPSDGKRTRRTRREFTGTFPFRVAFGPRIPSRLVASISSCLRLCTENNFGLVDGLIHASSSFAMVGKWKDQKYTSGYSSSMFFFLTVDL